MDSIARVLAVGALALTLGGCQLISTLVPIGENGGAALPEEGTCARYAVTAQAGEVLTPEALEQVRMIVENRVNAAGVAEPVVLMDAEGQLQVGLPGLGPESAEEFRQLIGTTGVLEFMPVPAELQGAVGEGPLPEGMADIEPLFTGVEIASAAIAQDPTTREIVVDLQLKETGARLFDDYAEQHYGEQFVIVLDNEVMSAPVIQATRFGGRAQISGGQGGFQPGEAQSLVTVLKFGSLPLGIREVGFGDCASTRSPGPAAEPST
jgi:protein-export membrane protein SecD